MGLVTAEAFCTVASATCDCNQKLGTCTANKTYDGAKITFTVSTKQCALVTYTVDDDPTSVTVTDGKEQVDYTPTRPHTPTITIDSCSICKTTP